MLIHSRLFLPPSVTVIVAADRRLGPWVKWPRFGAKLFTRSSRPMGSPGWEDKAAYSNRVASVSGCSQNRKSGPNDQWASALRISTQCFQLSREHLNSPPENETLRRSHDLLHAHSGQDPKRPPKRPLHASRLTPTSLLHKPLWPQGGTPQEVESRTAAVNATTWFKS